MAETAKRNKKRKAILVVSATPGSLTWHHKRTESEVLMGQVNKLNGKVKKERV